MASTDRLPFQLCNVQFITYAPSTGGVVNTTDLVSRNVQWWVPQPVDDSYANTARGVEAAITMTRKRFEVIAVVGAVMTDQIESTIENQPRRFPDDVGLRAVTEN